MLPPIQAASSYSHKVVVVYFGKWPKYIAK